MVCALRRLGSLSGFFSFDMGHLKKQKTGARSTRPVRNWGLFSSMFKVACNLTGQITT
jgi:hypothetical protein